MAFTTLRRILSVVLRRGTQIAKNSYNRDGLKGVLIDQTYLLNAIWHTLRNTPVASPGVTVPSPRDLGIFRTAEILAGRYEQKEASLVERYVPDGSDVLELGGGIGFITAVTEQTTDDLGTHVVLEVNPDLLPMLRQAKKTNELQVIVDPVAYSSNGDTVAFESGNTFTQSSIEESDTDGETIPAKSLEALIEEYDLNEFALIADIEGAETGLLDEEFETMASHCPIVILELHRSSLGEDLTPYLEKMRTEYTLLEDLDPVFAFRRSS